ncbi:hypothetical protein N7516_003768 [Penicillium verrucosum]|uniref:uncharacterized protein n=1 Tax=Penicillium verrucosum TaxID=60171 RepID=UPI0025453CC3|nr:uncharacterized protein N7516_003768 [Penicillium verrucosum]KAJ5943600.1 hypothetical protein N7516_003768 [Penicillium verrucosum]
MAPLPSRVNANTLSPREDKKYEVDQEKETTVVYLLFALIIAAIVILLGCAIYQKMKPKYKEEWKPKLKPKLRDCKEKYEDWKEKTEIWRGPKEPKAPKPAHVADRPVSQVPEVEQITSGLNPDYLKMSTAVVI